MTLSGHPRADFMERIQGGQCVLASAARPQAEFMERIQADRARRAGDTADDMFPPSESESEEEEDDEEESGSGGSGGSDGGAARQVRAAFRMFSQVKDCGQPASCPGWQSGSAARIGWRSIISILFLFFVICVSFRYVKVLRFFDIFQLGRGRRGALRLCSGMRSWLQVQAVGCTSSSAAPSRKPITWPSARLGLRVWGCGCGPWGGGKGLRTWG